MHRGRVVFGAMEEVVFGRPAREAIAEQMDRVCNEGESPEAAYRGLLKHQVSHELHR